MSQDYSSSSDSDIDVQPVRKKQKTRHDNVANAYEAELRIGEWEDVESNPYTSNVARERALTEEEQLDAIYGADVALSNPSLAKYFAQRYRLWSLYDEGIWMDETGWYSVTPELIGQHLANRCCDYTKRVTVIDAFAGVGGNSIQFALHENCERVISIDIDETRLMCAKHNAEIYGVADKIEFICGDYFHLLKSECFRRLCVDTDCLVAFLSPPWGGPEYLLAEEYDLETMMLPINGKHILELTRHFISPNICYLLPRNTPPKQVGVLARPGEPCEFEYNYLNKTVKTVAAYYGGIALKHDYETGEQLPVVKVEDL